MLAGVSAADIGSVSAHLLLFFTQLAMPIFSKGTSPNDAKLPMVYLGPEPWEGLWRNRHQLMSRFAKERTVVYIEPPYHLRKVVHEIRSRSGQYSIWYRCRLFHMKDKLYICKTGAFCPLSGRSFFKDVSWWNWKIAVMRTLEDLGIKKCVLWISRPNWYPATEMFQASRVIYHVVDEYSAYGSLGDAERGQIQRAEDQILDRADLIIVVSRLLYKNKNKASRNVHLVANGVDNEAYDAAIRRKFAPLDLMKIPKPRIGYSGLIAERLDLRLILNFARNRPNYSVVLLGSVNKRGCEAEVDALNQLHNVYFLGIREIHQIPDYIVGFDLCIIPYVNNERAANADPLKLYEYAAAGKITIATNISQSGNIESFCRTVHSDSDFIKTIDAELRFPPSAERIRKARAWAAENSWDSRVRQITKLLSKEI